MKNLEQIINCDSCGKARSDLDLAVMSLHPDLKNPNLPREEYYYCRDDMVCTLNARVWFTDKKKSRQQ